MAPHAILRLEGPLMAFGGTMVDGLNRAVDFPLQSTLTGLVASAMGVVRTQVGLLQSLQDRMSFAARIDRAGERVMDFQTAKLEKRDRAWTTRGVVQGRDGSPATYDSPHIRNREYHADRCVTVAMSVSAEPGQPGLDDVVEALRRPARPLFLGRKPCVPTSPILQGVVEGRDCLDALLRVPLVEPSPRGDRGIDALLVLAPIAVDFPGTRHREETLVDERTWATDVHAGWRRVRVGHIPTSSFGGAA